MKKGQREESRRHSPGGPTRALTLAGVGLWLLASGLSLPAATLTLGGAQALLIANNPAIAAAGTDVQKANAALAESKSVWWPSLDASASYTYLTEVSKIDIGKVLPRGFPVSTGPIPIGFHDNTQLGADLTWAFFTGFSRHYGVAGSRESLAAKRATYEGTKNAASLLLGVTYLQWILAYRQAAVQRTFVADLDSFARQSENRFQAGVALESGVLEARARLQFARADLVADSDRIDSLRAEIVAMILGSDQAIVPDTAIGAQLDDMKLPTEIDTARPELVALNHAAEQARLARQALHYRHLPTVSADLGGRYARPGLNLGIDEFMGWGLVGVSANWNLFDGFRTRAKMAELEQDRDYIEIAYIRQLQAMTTGFANARRQIASASQRLVACEASLAASLQLVRERGEQVAAGTATSTDYLNALTDLAQARLRVEQARTARRIAMLQQKYAAGKELLY